MLFVSFEYLGFFLALFAFYWFLPQRFQNGVLLAGNLFFFCFWDWRSALIVLLSGSAEWLVAGLLLRLRSGAKPRLTFLLLTASIGINIAAWLALKYFDFFISPLGLTVAEEARTTLSWVVPLGISFWTLQKMTYPLDVYYGLQKERLKWLHYLVFVSFFPTALSGPIEKVRTFLPQIQIVRHWQQDHLTHGCWLFFLGLFKKVFVSGQCQGFGEDLSEGSPTGWLVWLGTMFYALELYADFSGYSDMARGSARLLGLEIQQNFLAPYLSRNLSEYWQRWHTSLYGWLSAYVFAPTNMALRRLGMTGLVIAIWITFLLSGVWHGFGWTYLAWGAVHGVGMTFLSLSQPWRKKLKKKLGEPLWLNISMTIFTFQWVCLGLFFFQPLSMTEVLSRAHALLEGAFFSGSWVYHSAVWVGFAAIIGFIQAMEKKADDAFWIFDLRDWQRAGVYFLMLFAIMRFHAPAINFIYQQF